MGAAITSLVVGLGVAGAAAAAPARIHFRVEAKPYTEALIDIAQQANVSLVGAAACVGGSRTALSATTTLEDALAQVLAGAPCTWRVVAPGAVVISPAATAPPALALRPALPVTVGEVLVTATKRVRNARELAVAVTAIPRRELQATGASDAGEAAGQLAGVLATNLGPGRNKLLLRGLSDGAYTGRARSIVATYLDDLPINYNAPDPDLRLVDVERVEVARGPQGALYGAGSMSGIYRIVSRRPDLEHYGAELRATGATTDGGDASRAFEGFVNVPIWGDVIGLRASGYDEVQGGYLDDVVNGRSNVDRTERRGARISLLVQPTDAWSVNLTAAGQHLRSDDTHYTFPGLGRKRTVRIPEPHVNDIQLVTATVRGSWGWGEFTSSTGFVRHDYGSLYDATDTQRVYTDFSQTSAYSERARTNMLVQDAVLTSRGAGPLEWLVGVYGSDTRVHTPTQFLAQNPGLPNVPVYGDDRRDRIRELAGYGEVSYAFAPGWTAAVGGRAFNIRSHTHSDVVSERFPPRTVDESRNFTGVSPKVSVQREFRNGDLAYAVISEGYRSGGVNSGGSQPLSPTQQGFSPDRLINFEVGLKLTTLGGRASINSSVFYDIWKDIQTDQFRNFGIPYTTNAGDAHILGIETELALNAGRGFSVQLNGRLSQAKTGHVNPDFTSRLEDGLPGAPNVSAGAILSYERVVAGDWTLRVVGQANYVGRSRVTFDSKLSQMGGYARTKLSAELNGPHFGVQAYILNPLNDASDTFAFGNPFNADIVRQVTPQRPLTVGVTLSAGL